MVFLKFVEGQVINKKWGPQLANNIKVSKFLSTKSQMIKIKVV